LVLFRVAHGSRSAVWPEQFNALIGPEPAERIRQDGAAVLAVMAAVAVDKLVIIVSELECRGHLLIGEWPAPVRVVQIARAILQEDADRLAWRFAYLPGIDVAAPDIGEAAHVTQHFAEEVWPLPRHGKGADAAGALAANRATRCILTQLVFLADLGEYFFLQEARVLIREGVVLKAALCVWRHAGEGARVDEDADRHRHLLLVDQVVKDDRHAELF